MLKQITLSSLSLALLSLSFHSFAQEPVYRYTIKKCYKTSSSDVKCHTFYRRMTRSQAQYFVRLQQRHANSQKPENKRPENKRPENKQPENKQPENKQPENKQPENKQPENKQPENKQPTTNNSQCGSAFDQQMLAAVNKARQQGRTCGSTRYFAAMPLQLSCKLTQAAKGHSDYQAQSNRMSHTGANGSSMTSRIKATGYQGRAWSENVAYTYSDNIDQVMNNWLESPGHCKNIMSTTYTEMGAGKQQHQSNGRRFWTQNFGKPQ